MKFTSETKIFIGIILTTIFIVGVGITLSQQPAKPIEKSQLIRSDSIQRGAKNAQTYLVEFSDFQCPACGAFRPAVDSIMNKYSDKISFTYRNFPLPQHQFANQTAQAFEAANEQGKAWEMYTYLFDHQVSLSDLTIYEAAKQLGLDEEKFRKAITSNSYKEKIARDIKDGEVLGINSTPTFYLNGQKLDLSAPDDLIKAVEEKI
jgi:protein-disulfide isomerase